MLFHRLIMTGAVLTVLLGTSGCGMPADPVDLIKPPKTDADIPKDRWGPVLKSLLPEGSRLRTSGQIGIPFGDLDGDGTDEAIVVYEQNVHL